MNKVLITLPSAEKAQVEIVRYFGALGSKYLVFTKNEKDEQRFEKLYVSKINGNPAAMVGEFIEDDNEWSQVKGEFKRIIEENDKSGSNSTNDLNPSELENASIRGHRIIKISEDNVRKLSANQKQFEVESAPAGDDFDIFGGAAFGQSAPAYQEPTAPAYQAPAAPAYQAPAAPAYQAPAAPAYQAPAAPAYQAPAAPAYQEPLEPEFQPPVSDFPEMPTKPEEITSAGSDNYEDLYIETKDKLERCIAELEKVTNENVELRIKLDDIREILNEN